MRKLCRQTQPQIHSRSHAFKREEGGKRDSLKESALFPFFTGITACALWLCAQYMQREGEREREIEGDLREGPICRMSGRNQKTISQSRCLKFFLANVEARGCGRAWEAEDLSRSADLLPLCII